MAVVGLTTTQEDTSLNFVEVHTESERPAGSTVGMGYLLGPIPKGWLVGNTCLVLRKATALPGLWGHPAAVVEPPLYFLPESFGSNQRDPCHPHEEIRPDPFAATCSWTMVTNLVDQVRAEMKAYRATPRLSHSGDTLLEMERTEGIQRRRLMTEWSIGPSCWWLLLGLAHICQRAGGGSTGSLWLALAARILQRDGQGCTSGVVFFCLPYIKPTIPRATSRQSRYIQKREVRTRNAVQTSCDLIGVQTGTHRDSPNTTRTVIVAFPPECSRPHCQYTGHPTDECIAVDRAGR